MARYASGRYAWGYSDRSGFRYRLREMRKEWNGLKVGPDEYEAKHPQLEPVRHLVDPEALRHPRPDVPPEVVAGAGVVRTIDANSMMSVTGDVIGSEFSQDAATGEIGTVTVVIS